ncbi:MAG: PAS domain S-box-containing protein [Marinoscillum sp.]|jgi:PAS domain S-box-containing protein
MGNENEDNNNAVDELLDYKYAINQHSIVVITDKEGRITYVNDNFCELSKYTREEIIGQDHRIVNSGHHTKEFFHRMYETIHAGKVWKGDIKNKAKDGNFYWVSTTIAPLKDAKGDINNFIAIRTDITDNKSVQAELVAQNIRLFETQKAELEAKKEYQKLNEELIATNEALTKANALLKKREEELEESNTRFELAANAAKVGIWDRDLVNDHSIWDDVLYDLFGIADKNVDINDGNIWRKNILPDDLNDVDDAFKTALAGSDKFNLSYRVIWEDGSIHHLQANAIVHRDSSGKPIRLIGTVIDVTEQKEAVIALRQREEELAISNTRFQLAAKASNIGIWDRDLVNDYSYWDDTLYVLYGIKDTSIDINETRVWRSAIHPDDLKDTLATFKNALSQEETFEMVYRVIWEDQSIHHLQANAIIHRDSSGKPTRLIGTIIEVTEQNLYEQTLRESEEALAISNTRFLLAAKAGKIGISDRDIENNTAFWDDTLYDLFGIADQSSLNVKDDANAWHSLIHPDDRNTIIKTQKQAIQNADAMNAEFRVVWEDNSVHYLQTSGKVYLDGSGKPTRLIAVAMDITQQKLAEKALRESKEKYKRQNLLLEESQSVAKLGGWELDLITDKLYWTAETYRIHETSPEEYNLHIDEGISLFLPESKKIIDEALEAAKTIGRGYDLTLEKYTTKGRKIHVRTTCKVTLLDGKPAKLSGIIQDISKEKLVEKSLRESEEKYKRDYLLLEESQKVAKLGGWELNIITGKLYWTAETYRIHETSPEEFDPTVDAGVDYFLPESRKTISEALEKAMTTGEGYDLYLETYTTKGSRIHVRTTCAVTIQNGKPIKLTGIFQDITEQRKAQLEIETYTTRLSLATESASIGIWEFSIEEDLLFWDDQNCALFGLTKETFSGNYKGWKSTVHPEDLQYAEEMMNEAIANDSILNIEFRAIWPDKSIHYIGAFGQCVTDHTGKVVKLIGVNYDLTDRVERQIELEASNTILSIAKDAVRIGIWEYYMHDQRLICDDKMFDLYGITRDTFSGVYDAWTSSLHPDDLERSQQELENAIATGENFDTEFRIIWQDKSIRHIKALANFVSDANGKRIKMIGVNYDITERVEKEIELLKAKEKAEENDRLKSAFLANMRHEIRNPLNVIMGFSRQMIAPDTTKEDRAEYSGIVVNSSNQLLSIIDDITSFSLLETKQEHVNKSDVNINDLLSELQKQFASQAKTRNLELSFSTSLSSEQSVMATDKSKLTRIITNLLTNALKFTHQGFVKFGCEANEGELLFFVEDTGIGVATNHHKQIFGSFQQADTSVSRKYGGTGLGLSISKGLVEILGGKIWFESEVGRGSKFYVSLPHYQIKPTNSQSGVTGTAVKSNTILIAEDQAINFHYLKVLIQRSFKCDILHALNGEEAIELYKKNPSIALVLMDINMPVMDGFDSAIAIKAINPNMPIIAQTGYDILSHDKYSPDIFNDYVSKPIDEEVLLSKIAMYISKEDYSEKYT